MKLLLDTHLLVWVAYDSACLSSRIRSLINDPRHELFFSVASIWEIGIKFRAHRAAFATNPSALRGCLLDSGFNEVEITGDQTICASSLPLLHKDPFDRMLVSQAIVNGYTLLTADALLAKYAGPVRRV